MTSAEAFQRWLESFGLPVYASSSVTSDTKLPYVTYDWATGDILSGEVNETVNVWYRTTSEAVPNAKADEIGKALGLGGVMLPYDGGGLWLKKGSPFCQSVTEDGGNVKRRYLNVDIEFVGL